MYCKVIVYSPESSLREGEMKQVHDQPVLPAWDFLCLSSKKNVSWPFDYSKSWNNWPINLKNMAGYWPRSSSFLSLNRVKLPQNKFDPWAMFTHQCSTVVFNSGAPCMLEACTSGAPQPRKLGYLYIWEILVVTWPCVCWTIHPYHRETNKKSHTS